MLAINRASGIAVEPGAVRTEGEEVHGLDHARKSTGCLTALGASLEGRGAGRLRSRFLARVAGASRRFAFSWAAVAAALGAVGAGAFGAGFAGLDAHWFAFGLGVVGRVGGVTEAFGFVFLDELEKWLQ